VGPHDVAFDITFCGICHSDLHQVKSEWGPSHYPQVPGHELVGVVSTVGAAVTKFKPGDKVGVGCFVASCRSCKQCSRGFENYCAKSEFTYNSPPDAEGRLTYGGYSSKTVVHEDFVLRMPDALAMDAAAPLLCAGITTYSPMKIHGIDKPGMRVGVLGLGGLGSMAVQFGAAFGCEVTVISTSPGKEAASRELGAKHFLVSSNEEAMKAAAGSLDAIVDTVSAQHDIGTYLGLLDVGGRVVIVGVPPQPFSLHAFSLIGGGKSVTGSLVGGIPQTQEMLDFCAEKGIVSKIELIAIDQVNEAFARLVKNDVNGRFVIDMSTLKA